MHQLECTYIHTYIHTSCAVHSYVCVLIKWWRCWAITDVRTYVCRKGDKLQWDILTLTVFVSHKLFCDWPRSSRLKRLSEFIPLATYMIAQQHPCSVERRSMSLYHIIVSPYTHPCSSTTNSCPTGGSKQGDWTTSSQSRPCAGADWGGSRPVRGYLSVCGRVYCLGLIARTCSVHTYTLITIDECGCVYCLGLIARTCSVHTYTLITIDECGCLHCACIILNTVRVHKMDTVWMAPLHTP